LGRSRGHQIENLSQREEKCCKIRIKSRQSTEQGLFPILTKRGVLKKKEQGRMRPSLTIDFLQEEARNLRSTFTV